MNIKKITAAVMAVTILAGMTACGNTAEDAVSDVVIETTTVEETTTAEITTTAETQAANADSDFGWYQDEKGNYYIDEEDGRLTGYKIIDGDTYIFDDDGYMMTGLTKHGYSTYYLADDGKMHYEFQTIDNKLYYFGLDGKMRKGWLDIDGNVYYFTDDGYALCGKQNVGGEEYEFSDKGVLESEQKPDGIVTEYTDLWFDNYKDNFNDWMDLDDDLYSLYTQGKMSYSTYLHFCDIAQDLVFEENQIKQDTAAIDGLEEKYIDDFNKSCEKYNKAYEEFKNTKEPHPADYESYDDYLKAYDDYLKLYNLCKSASSECYEISNKYNDEFEKLIKEYEIKYGFGFMPSEKLNFDSEYIPEPKKYNPIDETRTNGEYHTYGEEIMFDLNSDGEKEKITYNYKKKDTGEVIDYVAVLNVNGSEHEIGEQLDNFIICDIDPTDKYFEIGLSTRGGSEDYATEFLRYDDGKLYSIGWTPDSVDGNGEYVFELSPAYGSCLKINGDGTVMAAKRLDIFQTWFAYTTYKFNEKTGQLEEVVPDVYYPYGKERMNDYTGLSSELYVQEDRSTHTTVTFTLYSEMDETSETVTLEPQSIVVTATDNKGWIYIIGESGIGGWLQCDGHGIDGIENAFMYD